MRGRGDAQEGEVEQHVHPRVDHPKACGEYVRPMTMGWVRVPSRFRRVSTLTTRLVT